MKVQIALLAGLGLAVAHPSRHVHHSHHHDARDAAPASDVVSVAGPTVIMYELNGSTISKEDVEEGIKNGTLVWANGAPQAQSAPVKKVTPQSSSSSSAAPSTTASSPASSSVYVAPSTTSSVEVSTSNSASSSSSAPSSASSSSSGSGSYSAGTGIDADFPSGTIDCSDFPSAYGAMAVDYIGLGGWIGIQSPGSSNGGFSDITTVEASSCSGGNCCSEGMYCSYACPAGYQKSQWPTTQGLTGQSVGGLLCQNGKLQLTNSEMSSSLCIPGAEQVTVLVQNELSQNVAVCRTDYPGTESETVPLDVAAGSSDNLTCPDSNEYYKWKGGSTSAQYYVNPAGVAVKDACQWGSNANPWGNYAPLNLGVGYSNGAAWLAIFQNAPTTDAKLDFTVEIVGDNVVGSCKYSNGQYCSGNSCSPTTGCTVSISSGTATFVFSD